MSAKRIFTAFLVCAVTAGVPAFAQDTLMPAELPPSSFDGREYVDSRGCVFLRSTFGGQVTWVPRFGPDRQPICNGQTTVVPVETPAAPVPAPAPDTAVAAAPNPAVRPVPQPVGQVRLPPATALGKEPPRRVARASTPRKVVRHVHPRGPNADGRHPDCPLNAQFGRLVRMETGKIMVMCVMSPDLFPAGATAPAPVKSSAAPVKGAQTVTHAPAPVATRGSVLQVGSFGVAANANRVHAHLQAQGIPAHLHHAGHLVVVTAGPFADSAAAHRAMGVVRGMGIRDAFFR